MKHAATSTAAEPVLRARVDEQTKARFEAICHRFGETASDRLRQLVIDFVREHAGALDNRIDVKIERPQGFDHGAWRITASLKFPEEAFWNGSPISFPIPPIEQRHVIISDPEYRAAVLDPQSGQAAIGGRFSDGRWRADLYSNGVPEEGNATPVDEVRRVLTATIEDVLNRFHGAGTDTQAPPAPGASPAP
ncbi:hypothetical protein WL30_24535 [Burkholderia ubonensis]|nr:hypothetical protein [Burkholderia ubonensis]KWA81683.1 hypothetical protein WL30_24535 [Burkholderia ubonensis]KWB34703.1 hypothetical protein WL31_22225 [Burkholderia ubonensis]